MVKCGDTGVQCDEANGRLPRPSPFIPVHYELELQPDIYRPAPPFPLSGHVSIHVHCGAQTETMTLNMDSSVNVVNLSIVALSSSDQQPSAINHVRFTRNKQTMFIQYIGWQILFRIYASRFRRHLVDKTLINVRYCDTAWMLFAGKLMIMWAFS